MCLPSSSLVEGTDSLLAVVAFGVHWVNVRVIIRLDVRKTLRIVCCSWHLSILLQHLHLADSLVSLSLEDAAVKEDGDENNDCDQDDADDDDDDDTVAFFLINRFVVCVEVFLFLCLSCSFIDYLLSFLVRALRVLKDNTEFSDCKVSSGAPEANDVHVFGRIHIDIQVLSRWSTMLCAE